MQTKFKNMTQLQAVNKNTTLNIMVQAILKVKLKKRYIIQTLKKTRVFTLILYNADFTPRKISRERKQNHKMMKG